MTEYPTQFIRMLVISRSCIDALLAVQILGNPSRYGREVDSLVLRRGKEGPRFLASEWEKTVQVCFYSGVHQHAMNVSLTSDS